MRATRVILAALFWLGLLAVASWLLGLDELLRASIAAGHLLDWVVGLIGLVWLVLLLKVPWDLYFEALQAGFDLQQARDAGRDVAPEREQYLRVLRPRLLWLALGAHLASGAVAAAAGLALGGPVGYWLAAVYIVSATLRPLGAAYLYLRHRLHSMGEEARYPRLDVNELRDRLVRVERRLAEVEQKHADDAEQQRQETAELRGQVQRTARELETAVAKVTDNQDVIKGIRAFVRLVSTAGEG